MHKLTQEILEQTITKRANATHKGDYGRILIIGGTEQYGGAVIMNALAAVNSGSGLVTVATHPSNFTALHSHLPEAMPDQTREQGLKKLSNCLVLQVKLMVLAMAQMTSIYSKLLTMQLLWEML